MRRFIGRWREPVQSSGSHRLDVTWALGTLGARSTIQVPPPSPAVIYGAIFDPPPQFPTPPATPPPCPCSDCTREARNASMAKLPPSIPIVIDPSPSILRSCRRCRRNYRLQPVKIRLHPRSAQFERRPQPLYYGAQFLNFRSGERLAAFNCTREARNSSAARSRSITARSSSTSVLAKGLPPSIPIVIDPSPSILFRLHPRSAQRLNGQAAAFKTLARTGPKLGLSPPRRYLGPWNFGSPIDHSGTPPPPRSSMGRFSTPPQFPTPPATPPPCPCSDCTREARNASMAKLPPSIPIVIDPSPSILRSCRRCRRNYRLQPVKIRLHPRSAQFERRPQPLYYGAQFLNFRSGERLAAFNSNRN